MSDLTRTLRAATVVLAFGLLSFACAAPDADSGGADAPDTPPPETSAPPGPGGPGGGPPPAWVAKAVAQPRGLLRNEEGTADGYVLVAPIKTGFVYLVDREGRVVHSWEQENIGMTDHLLDDGSILRAGGLAEPPNFKAGGVAGNVRRISWEGDVLWNWTLASREQILHHDLEPLPNGNLLLLAWELKSKEDAIAAGRRPELVPDQGVWVDWLLEVEPVGADDVRVVWEWHVWDHLVQDHDAELANFGDPKAEVGKLDLNADLRPAAEDEEELAQLKALGYVPGDATTEDLQSDFLHVNSVDYHAGLDQIALSVPALGELWILDHSTTTEEAKGPAGDVLYRWGNPKTIHRGEPGDKQLFFQHQVEWIPEGSPHAGNLTLFDNGQGRPDGEFSRVVEIEPPLRADGTYGAPGENGWPPAEPTWTWRSPGDESLFSPIISGAHRLPNGNTFVCFGVHGHLFEVTPAGEVVWEYRNPYSGEAIGWMPPEAKLLPYPIFRARKIPADHPGLAGRDLSPLEPQPEPFVFEPPGPPPG